MRASKALLSLFMIVLCLISLNVGSVSVADQICFKLLPPPGLMGAPVHILELGVINYGNNNHFAVSGTDTPYVMPDFADAAGLVHGNAEIVNGKVEVSRA